MEEMTHIAGVGVGKAQKDGKRFIELIRNYVEENEIQRPQDFVVKSVVNKSANKVFIIQGIDRKIDFEDIAIAKGLEFDELLTEMEMIVASGTKINIDYYIDEEIEEYHQEEILEYFANAESDSVEKAFEELEKLECQCPIGLHRISTHPLRNPVKQGLPGPILEGNSQNILTIRHF